MTETVSAIVLLFIPLPEPLAIPDDWSIRLEVLGDPDNEVVLRVQTEDGLYHMMKGSLLFHRIEQTTHDFSAFFSPPAFAAAAKALSDSPENDPNDPNMWQPFSDGDHLDSTDNDPNNRQPPSDEDHLGSTDNDPGWSTVVEAAIFLDTDIDNETLSEALGYSLEQIRGLQKMYHMVSYVPVTLITKELLPMAIPVVVRGFDDQNLHPTEVTRSFLYIVNRRSMDKPRFSKQWELSKETLDQLTDNERLWPGPFAPYLDFTREAAIAVRNGNWLVASVLTGAAAEAFLRELHATLMWDEGLEPKDAADEIKKARLITYLVSSRFHSRLGGIWKLKGEGPIADWRRDVADLRNRVIHTGYEPDETDVYKACAATDSLKAYVGTLLKNRTKIEKYPFTTSFVLGYDRIEDMGKTYSRTWDLAVQSFYGTNPAESFGAWRREVERQRVLDPKTDGDPARGKLVCVNYMNGEVRYWLVDDEVGLACQARPPDCSESLFAEKSLGLGDTGVETLITLAEVRPVAADDPPQWVPSIEVIPSIVYRRFLTCFVPPSVPTPGITPL